jgi:hypothetical protein
VDFFAGACGPRPAFGSGISPLCDTAMGAEGGGKGEGDSPPATSVGPQICRERSWPCCSLHTALVKEDGMHTRLNPSPAELQKQFNPGAGAHQRARDGPTACIVVAFPLGMSLLISPF